MALDKSLKLAIEAKLRLGIPPADVARQLDVKAPTVYAINQKLEKVLADEQIQELHTIPQSTIASMVEETKKKQVPIPTPQSKGVIKEMDAVVVGLDGLKKLDSSFQTTVAKALKRFDEILDDKDTPLKDIKMIVDTTASAYEKVFSSGTNIHIGDNNTNSSQQLTIFKNKQGV